MASRPFVIALAMAVIAAAGCFLVTGSTSGYTQEAPEGGCEAAADCDGGVCCLSSTSFSASCQMAPCGSTEVQLCAEKSECTADAACLEQSCTAEGMMYSIRTCGKIALSICTVEKD
jgi:hypothetical protein